MNTDCHRVIYGPVPSWRLGRSLGIDLLSRPNTCSFDCIYCQLGPTRHHTRRRQEYVPTSRVLAELATLPSIEVDFITFSGMGEPTLAANLGEVIVHLRTRLARPVAVLTNSSLLADAKVRAELCLADQVVAKLDAPDEDLFRAINRPFGNISLAEVVEGLRRLRAEYRGRLAIQMMFCEKNRPRVGEMAALVKTIHPDEVQLNTPLRPSATPPLTEDDMRQVEFAFDGLSVTMVYDAEKVNVEALNAAETASRRPSTDNRS